MTFRSFGRAIPTAELLSSKQIIGGGIEMVLSALDARVSLIQSLRHA